MKFRPGEPGYAFNVAEVNLTAMQERWAQMEDMGKSPCAY